MKADKQADVVALASGKLQSLADLPGEEGTAGRIVIMIGGAFGLDFPRPQPADFVEQHRPFYQDGPRGICLRKKTIGLRLWDGSLGIDEIFEIGISRQGLCEKIAQLRIACPICF